MLGKQTANLVLSILEKEKCHDAVHSIHNDPLKYALFDIPICPFLKEINLKICIFIYCCHFHGNIFKISN